MIATRSDEASDTLRALEAAGGGAAAATGAVTGKSAPKDSLSQYATPTGTLVSPTATGARSEPVTRPRPRTSRRSCNAPSTISRKATRTRRSACSTSGARQRASKEPTSAATSTCSTTPAWVSDAPEQALSGPPPTTESWQRNSARPSPSAGT